MEIGSGLMTTAGLTLAGSVHVFNGKWFYFDENAGVLTGLVITASGSYYVDAISGMKVNDWACLSIWASGLNLTCLVIGLILQMARHGT